MSKAPTMVIADDHPMLRAGLKEHLAGEGGFVVLGAVGDAHAAIVLCRQHQPDLLLLDVEMPGRDPLGAMVDIKAASPGTRIVILTAFCRDSVIDVAVRGGAAGYLLKTDAPGDLLLGLARVMKGERVYSKDVQARLARSGRGAGHGEAVATLLCSLSPRELEVLRYIGKGQDNATMAAAMHISIRTVERHVLRLMRDLKINDRTRLTALAHESGLVN